MRSAAAGQLATPSRHIFTTKVTQRDGTTRSVVSAQPLGDTSVRINARENIGPLTLLKQFSLKGNFRSTANSAVLKLNYDALNEIFAWTLGVGLRGELELVVHYPKILTAPRTFHQSLFQQIKIDPYVIVDAAMRGEEEIVLNILKADPSYLLKKAKVKNSVGVEHFVTPLQAAIMANDIQMAERMQEHFARLTTDLAGNPIDGLAEMQKQINAIYIQSLNRYIDMQKAVLKEQEAKQLELLQSPTDLNETQEERYKKTVEKIKQATKNIATYKTALEQNDIQKIIEAHNLAQEHNTFDFQPYVDAICNIDLNDPLQTQQLDDVMALINATTPEETKAAIAKGVSPTEIGFTDKNGRTYTREEIQDLPFNQLTLIQKLNRFREKSINHQKQEIIFNPYHTLTGLKHNEKTWDEVAANRITDPDCKKRSVIFSQLIGWKQRNAAEPVKQDIRQGTWYLTEENERRARPSRFNTVDSHGNLVRNSIADASSLDSRVIDGWGYKFAGRERPAALVFVTRPSFFFKTYVEQKQQAFRTCYAALVRAHAHKPERSCVAS